MLRGTVIVDGFLLLTASSDDRPSNKFPPSLFPARCIRFPYLSVGCWDRHRRIRLMKWLCDSLIPAKFVTAILATQVK